MQLEYLASNELNKYPFRDYATLASTDGAWTFTNDFFLDTVVVVKQPQVFDIHLSQFQNNPNGQSIALQYSDGGGTNVLSFSVPYSSLVDRGVFSFATSVFAIKLVFGPGAARIASSSDTALHTFNLLGGGLEASAVVQMVPRVTELEFYNWDNNLGAPATTPVASFLGSETSLMDVTVKGGNNIVFDFTNGVGISVTPGGGAGLYNACADELVIKSINDTHPDAYGNFLLEADECYTETIQSHGLFINNTCTPKCSEEQLGAFAHYLNRVKDGLSTVSAYAIEIYNTLETEYTHLTTIEIPSRNKPYMKVAYVSSVLNEQAGTYYFSFAVGLYNPSGEQIAATAAMTTNGTIVKTDLPVNTTIDCLKSHTAYFVVSGVAGTSVAISGTLGTTSVNQTISAVYG